MSMEVVNFDYSYPADRSVISRLRHDHRYSDPCTEFSYDGLDRITRADYGIEAEYETFPMDDLGNRDGDVYLRDGGYDAYVVNDVTNQYTTIAGESLSYDPCGTGSLIEDQRDYQYE